MKVDVVCVFHESKWPQWPYCAVGIRANHAHISTLIMSRDGAWSTAEQCRVEADVYPLHVEFDEFPHDGTVQLSRAYNAGLAIVSTPYHLKLVPDGMLASGSMAPLIRNAAPAILVSAASTYVEEPFDLSDDIEEQKLNYFCARQRHITPSVGWFYCGDHALLIHTQTARDIGGYNEKDLVGFGMQDIEFGLRHALYTGNPDNVSIVDDAHVYHVGAPSLASWESKSYCKPWSLPSLRYMDRMAARYAKRFALTEDKEYWEHTAFAEKIKLLYPGA